jgi:hypothetical protein
MVNPFHEKSPLSRGILPVLCGFEWLAGVFPHAALPDVRGHKVHMRLTLWKARRLVTLSYPPNP